MSRSSAANLRTSEGAILPDLGINPRTQNLQVTEEDMFEHFSRTY